MEDAVRTVASYSTSIEMAFAASLLLGTWGGLYRSIADQHGALIKKVEGLQEAEVLRHQVMLEDLAENLKNIYRKWKNWWLAGLILCGFCALGIYVMMWCVPPETPVGGWLWAVFLGPFAGPLCMARMFYLGTRGNKEGLNATAKLEAKKDELENAALQVGGGP